MKILFLSVLLITSNIVIGQKINYSIEFGSNVSFLSDYMTRLEYSCRTFNHYNNETKLYKRNGGVGYGATVGTKLKFKLNEQFYLISGLSLNYLVNKISTTLLYSTYGYHNTIIDHPTPLLLTHENIMIYWLEYLDNYVLIDENGLPIYLRENMDSEDYKINEKIKNIYLSIPIMLGFSVSRKIDFTIGVKTNILLNSDIATSYPVENNDINKNNLSYSRKFLFSFQCGFSFKISEKISLLTNYQRSFGSMIRFNSRYNVSEGNNVSVISFGINYLLKKKQRATHNKNLNQ